MVTFQAERPLLTVFKARYVESQLVDIFKRGLHGLIIDVGASVDGGIAETIIQNGGYVVGFSSRRRLVGY